MCTKEMPALESRRVRTHPLTVTRASLGARPARMSAQLIEVMRNLGEKMDASHRNLRDRFAFPAAKTFVRTSHTILTGLQNGDGSTLPIHERVIKSRMRAGT